jgi:transposase
VTAADQGDRTQVAALAEEVQQVTGKSVELAYVDRGYTGHNAAEAAQQHGIQLEVVKHPMAKRGFVLLPKRSVVERSFVWAARFRRLARDSERLLLTHLAQLHNSHLGMGLILEVRAPKRASSQPYRDALGDSPDVHTGLGGLSGSVSVS